MQYTEAYSTEDYTIADNDHKPMTTIIIGLFRHTVIDIARAKLLRHGEIILQQ